jgi:hypothetical protein
MDQPGILKNGPNSITRQVAGTPPGKRISRGSPTCRNPGDSIRTRKIAGFLGFQANRK